jgi:predicted HD phosphohydrolase
VGVGNITGKSTSSGVIDQIHKEFGGKLLDSFKPCAQKASQSVGHHTVLYKVRHLNPKGWCGEVWMLIE